MFSHLNFGNRGMGRVRSTVGRKVFSAYEARSMLSSMAAINSEIHSFPEYKLASEQEWKGNFKSALPNYLRVKDVMVSTTGGPYTDYSAMVSLRIARLYCSMGKYKEAIDSLGHIEQYQNNIFKVHAYQMVSTCYILEGSDVHAALEAACEGATVCENLQNLDKHSDDHYPLFSKNYTLQGVSCLLLGQLTPADEHFQLAARWAENPTDKLISLSNIGSLYCAMAHFLPPAYNNSSLSFPSQEESVTSRDMVRKTALIRDGLEYWQEAVTEATQTQTNSNAAYAMCGPFDAASPLGPGMDAVSVPASSSSSEEQAEKGAQKTAGTVDVGDNLAKDSMGYFTTAYVTVLCNIAEAEIKLGNKSRAAEHVSSALAALTVNTQHHPENGFLLSPFLGRCLYLSGCDHFHSGDFVVAEGLFRAAIEKFQLNSFCEVDTRHAYELMRTMHSYGSLLQKWDKRESEGDHWIARAHALAAQIPSYPVHSGSFSPSPSQSLEHEAGVLDSLQAQNGHMAQVSHFLLMLPSY